MIHPSKRFVYALLMIVAAAACSSNKEAGIGHVENGLVPPVRIRGDKGWNMLERMKFYNIPGVRAAGRFAE